MHIRIRLAAVVAALLVMPSPLPASPGPTDAAGAPVTVEFLGLNAARDHVRYRIHVQTDKAIEQVDLALTYRDGKGSPYAETVVWQNIVKSRRQPIEKGKTYEDDSYVAPEASAVGVKLQRVVYTDRTTWSPRR